MGLLDQVYLLVPGGVMNERPTEDDGSPFSESVSEAQFNRKS